MMKIAMLILSSFLMLGCVALQQPYPMITTYSLDPGQGLDASKDERSISLNIKPFSISPTFDSKSLVYKTGDFIYETDYYHRFMTAPANMFTEKISDWLTTSPKVKYVFDSGYKDGADFILYGKIMDLFGDFSNKDKPRAILHIRIIVVDEREGTPKIILNKIYSQETPLGQPSAAALINGFNQGLVNILKDFESDLSL
jgi:cholesterol transport system auxiliary component